jgi:hypothetical protein
MAGIAKPLIKLILFFKPVLESISEKDKGREEDYVP